MNASRYQVRQSFAQDLQRLFPGLTVKYTDYYYRLTNRFTNDDLIVLPLQESPTELTLHRMIALRRHLPPPVLFAALKLVMYGMGAEDMSRLHGVTVSAVRQRIRHALDKLGMAGQLRIAPTTLLNQVTHNPGSHLTLMELSAAGLNDAGFPDMPEQAVPDMPQDRVRNPVLVSGFY